MCVSCCAIWLFVIVDLQPVQNAGKFVSKLLSATCTKTTVLFDYLTSLKCHDDYTSDLFILVAQVGWEMPFHYIKSLHFAHYFRFVLCLYFVLLLK
jgi:hypothetical protein